MRDQRTLTKERQALSVYARSATSAEFSRFLRGAGAALDWAAGTGVPAPVSGSTPRPGRDLILAEVQRCDVLLVGVEVEAGRPATADPHFVNGVEHALRWLLELEAEPPVPLDDGHQSAQLNTDLPAA